MAASKKKGKKAMATDTTALGKKLDELTMVVNRMKSIVENVASAENEIKTADDSLALIQQQIDAKETNEAQAELFQVQKDTWQKRKEAAEAVLAKGGMGELKKGAAEAEKALAAFAKALP